MALTVEITGGKDIEQGGRVTVSAVVTDADGNTPPGTLQYAWSASRGSFVGNTNEATAVYHADFTDTDAVDVAITCNVTRPANATPTSSGPSLTALAEIGVTGILVNMFMTALGAVAANTNNVLYNASTGTLDTNSDQRLSSNINIFQLRWDNTTNHFVLNNNEAGIIGDFFRNNNNQSIYLIFADGTYKELTPTDFANANSAGMTWARWEVTDTAILALLNALSATADLVVGVADAGSIGWDLDTGSDTETVTAAVAKPLGIEAIDEQFIALGTQDYDLIIDITGNPDTAEATGHMEGFSQDWDAANAQLHIKAEDVTRLIAGVFWTVKLTKGSEVLTADIAYNVVKAAPIFETLAMLHLYRDVPINIDILIQNIPDLIVPNARLLGLKSELQDYGLNIKGELPADANFSKNDGDISMIVPSETGGTSEMHDYAYEIESGSPPAIVNPNWQPKGNYGAVSFADVNHALSYEWRLGDAAEWNFFSDTRNVIDPSTIAVTPGNLNVTLKFPNIAGASSYAYMLESETHNVDWTEFVGTFENNMITTIIPNLEDGATYTLWLRVASPWVGTPVSIQITGGRLAYSVNNAGANSTLYIFHTGALSSGVLSIIKKILLPTGLTTPIGIAINGTTAYCLNNDKSVYVFSTETADNTRASLTKKFSLLNTTANARSIAFYENRLYIAQNLSSSQSGLSHQTHIHRIDPNTANNGTASPIDGFRPIQPETNLHITENFIFVMQDLVNTYTLNGYDRKAVDRNNVARSIVVRFPTLSAAARECLGLSVIGSKAYYIVKGINKLYSADLNTATQFADTVESDYGLPAGLASPAGLDIPV